MTVIEPASPAASGRSLRENVENFIYREARLLDTWQLDTWLDLFDSQGRYEVTPPGESDLETISPQNVYFLIADDHTRLNHRISRLKNPSAHAEWPRSRVMRMYSNVIIEEESDEISVSLNFLVFKTRRGSTTEYFGRTRFVLVRNGVTFKIRSKRVMMDIDALVPQSTVAFLL